MAIIGDALRQAFMPKLEYDSLREEEKAWGRLQRPLVTAVAAVVWFGILVAVSASLSIVFPPEAGRRPFCRDRRIQGLSLKESDVRQYGGTFYLTDEEAADYYWMVVFIPSAIVFFSSGVYLLAGMAVAYSAPARNPCLKVVENNYCASKRGALIIAAVLFTDMMFLFQLVLPACLTGGVRCLSIINIIFAVVFGLLALFLGSSLLTLGSSCSVPLFWCYEIAAWGMVFLYGGTAFFLRRKAAVVLDQGDFAGRNLGVEMLEPIQEVTPDMERRLNEGFKAWMGSSLLSSDEEDGPDDYIEEGYHLPRTNSDVQRS